MNLYESIKKNLNESVKVGPIYRLGTEEIITSYNDIRLDEIGITLEDIELFKRVDTSESAPDKVNYLLYISMRWDGDDTMSVPISYNITDGEYEEEINPPMLGIIDEDLDLKVYNTVDEVVRNLALKISHSGRLSESEKIKEISDSDLKVGDTVIIKKENHHEPYKATVIDIDRKLGLLEYHIEGYGFVEDGFVALPKSKFMGSLKNVLDNSDK